MFAAADMTAMLARNLWVVERQTAGLTHADSMLQLPFRGNCLNWVLGHLVVSRDYMLRIAGAGPLWDEGRGKVYGYDSPALQADDDAVPMETILADLKTSQERLAAAMAALDDAQLDAPLEGGSDDSLRDRLAFMTWHDGYHAGQTEYLRQLTGVNDRVI